MKKLLTLKKSGGISLMQHVEMFGLLLYDILDFFDKGNEEILVGEIDTFVSQLGYQGTLSSVHDMLLCNDFLTKIEAGNRYILSNSNRSAIECFFLKHKNEFEGNRLTDIEYAHILGSSGIQGSRAEALLAQVMGSLAFLMDTLLQIPSIESSIRAEIVEHATKSLILMERAKWKTERLYQLDKSIDIPDSYFEEVRKTCKFIDDAEQQSLLLDKSLHDMEILQTLQFVQRLISQVVIAFSAWEEKLNKNFQ